MKLDAQMLYIMLALPAMFGLTLVGEGLYKMSHYEPGWMGITLGTLFLVIVAFGFFLLRGYVT